MLWKQAEQDNKYGSHAILMKKNKIHLLVDQIELIAFEQKIKHSKKPKMKLMDKIFTALGWFLAIPHLIKMGFLHLWHKIFKK